MWYHPRVNTPERWPELSPHIVAIARRAGDAILKVIQGDLDVRAKANASPVTAADEAADAIIVATLGAASEPHQGDPSGRQKGTLEKACHPTHPRSLDFYSAHMCL